MFTGWYLGESETPFAFETTPVTADITLVAGFSELEGPAGLDEVTEYTVTFQAEGQADVVETVEAGTPVNMPADPALPSARRRSSAGTWTARSTISPRR